MTHRIIGSVAAGSRVGGGGAGGGGAGSWVFLEEIIASAASTVSFEALDTTFDVHSVVFANHTQSNDNTDLRARVGVGGTPTYSGVTYFFHVSDPSSGGTGYTASAGESTTSWIIVRSVGATAGEGASGELRLYGATSTTAFKRVVGDATGHNEVAKPNACRLSGGWNTTTAVTALQIFPAAGTLTGTYRLYGLATS